MKGFVKNEGTEAFFILQRPVSPGGKVSFEDAYVTVGKKSGKKEGVAFVRWLRDNYFAASNWVFYKEEGVPFFSAEEAKVAMETSVGPVDPGKGAGKVMRRQAENTAKGTAITAKSIIEAPYAQAKVLIDKCADKSVLKKALAASRHFSQREDHMRHIMKRLEQIY
jgi:hypothetical protein